MTRQTRMRTTLQKQHSQNQNSLRSANQSGCNQNWNRRTDLSGTLLKRWVKVLSQYKPTSAEMPFLGKGLNFASAPNHILAKEIVKVTEVACKKLDDESRSDSILP